MSFSEDAELVKQAKRIARSRPRPGPRLFAPEVVTEIRRKYVKGGISQKKLAREYGCSPFTMNAVLLGRGCYMVKS